MANEKRRADYEQHRKKMAQRMRDMRSDGADIGPIPDVADSDRRASCELDLKLFCETYREQAFCLGWSDDHLRVIDRMQQTALRGGLFALAMPRGTGKTTIAITAAMWGLLYGHRAWVCLIGATQPKAKQLLKGIKTELRFNQLLAADFPEVCYPIQALEGKAARATGQTCQGSETNIEWLTEAIRLPAIPGSVAAGGRVSVCGITGDIRGQQETLETGEVVRPDWAILDDPQTRESAKSGSQTDDRLAILNGDVLGLAGPTVKIAGVMPCTVVYRGDMADQTLDTEASAQWHGQRTQLLYGMPSKDAMQLWHQYREIQEASYRNGGEGEEATEFYIANRAAMDEGCRAAWPERFNEDEVSAIQNAMNLFYRDEEAFWSEYQNQPIEQQGDAILLSEDDLKRRVSHLPRFTAGPDADTITAFVDVQGELLYYAVTAWRNDYLGQVIDYGAWPDQGTTNFRLNQAKRTISGELPGLGFEEKLRGALHRLTAKLCGVSWLTEEGAELSISRLLIDANWGVSRDVVYDYCRASSNKAVLYPSHGKYVGAASLPLNAAHIKKAGRKVGAHWRIDKAKDKPNKFVLYDTNHWKSFLQSRINTDPGQPGSLSLWNDTPRTHATMAKHLRAEFPVRTEGRGREVDEWKLKPDRPDNHWLDCLVGCCVGASIEGCALPGEVAVSKPEKRKRKRQGASTLGA